MPARLAMCRPRMLQIEDSLVAKLTYPATCDFVPLDEKINSSGVSWSERNNAGFRANFARKSPQA